MARVEILPTPKVSEATAINSRAMAAGTMPEGSLRLDQISCGAYTLDMLLGRVIPAIGNEAPRPLQGRTPDPQGRPQIPDDVDFYFEVVEDQRGDVPPERLRFRPTGKPWRNEGGLYWALNVEVADQPEDRLGGLQGDDVDIVG